MPKVQGHCQLRIAGKSISLEVITPLSEFTLLPPSIKRKCFFARTLQHCDISVLLADRQMPGSHSHPRLKTTMAVQVIGHSGNSLFQCIILTEVLTGLFASPWVNEWTAVLLNVIMLSTSCVPLKPEGHLSSQNLSGEMAHRCALVPKGAELWDMGVGYLMGSVLLTETKRVRENGALCYRPRWACSFL